MSADTKVLSGCLYVQIDHGAMFKLNKNSQSYRQNIEMLYFEGWNVLNFRAIFENFSKN